MNWTFLFALFSGITWVATAADDHTHHQPTYGQTIPDTAWQVTQDPERDLFDAAYLVHYTGFHKKQFHHYRLIRILSEEGKAAAEFSSYSKSLISVRGRVLYPDGETLTFDSTEDFVELLAYRVRRKKVKSTILIPPGLTTDCIVEMEWFEKPATGRHKNFWHHRYDVRDEYYCLEKIFDVQGMTKGKRPDFVWLVQEAQDPIDFTHSDEKEVDPAYIFKNVPPIKAQPFGNPHQAPNTPSFIIHTLFASAMIMGHEDWDGKTVYAFRDYLLIIRIIQSEFDSLPKNKKLAAFAAQIKYKLEKEEGVDLKKEPIRATKLVLKALQKKISVTNRLNPDQLVRFRDQETPKSDNLNYCFSNEWANPKQMNLLFIGLLRKLDIRMKFVYANPINSLPFDETELTPFSFDWSMPLVMIEEPEQRAMFCAWRPEFPPGMLPNELQGTPALTFEPYNLFRKGNTTTLQFGPKANVQTTLIEAQLEADGHCRLSMEQTGTGIYKTATVRRLYHLRQQDQTPYLTRRWQRRLGDDYALNVAELAPITDLQDPIKLRVQAEIDYDSQGERLSIKPFPGLDANLAQPSMWPGNRTQPINFPYSFVKTDTLRLTLPEGWKLIGLPSRQRENQVGSVAFVANQEGREVTVQRILTLKGNRLTAAAENQLRYFLAWVDEAELQTIAVAKGGVN